MKLYRAIIRDTRYTEGYKGSVELFKSKKSLKEWFDMKKKIHNINYEAMKIVHNHVNPFTEVLVGIEEVEAK